MLIQEIKGKIAFEVLTTYMAAVNTCATIVDLQAPSKLMMKQVTDLVFPKLRLELMAVDMPQDVLGEESKDQVESSKGKLVKWMKELETEIEIKKVEITQDLSLLK